MAHRLAWALGVLLAATVLGGCGGDSDEAANEQSSAGAAALAAGTGGSAADAGGTGASRSGTGGNAGAAGRDTGGAGGDTTAQGGTAAGAGGSTAGTAGSTGATGGTVAAGGNAGATGTGGRGGNAGAAGRGTGGDTGGDGGSPAGAGGSSGGSAAGAGGSSGGTGPSGGSASGGEAGQAQTDCAALSQAIAEEASGVTTCTAVVRLDYETYEIVGFDVLCAAYSEVDESTARQTAQDDTGYGLDGELLSGAEPEDEYVFYESPLDFGGVGVVNARNGLSVFGGSIIWAGIGEITYPSAWRPAADIGPDCIPVVNALPPTARGIDLSAGQGSPEQSQVEAAVNRAWTTALPDGLLRGHYVFDAMVLLYARRLGAFDPAAAEWIVLINSGWLE